MRSNPCNVIYDSNCWRNMQTDNVANENDPSQWFFIFRMSESAILYNCFAWNVFKGSSVFFNMQKTTCKILEFQRMSTEDIYFIKCYHISKCCIFACWSPTDPPLWHIFNAELCKSRPFCLVPLLIFAPTITCYLTSHRVNAVFVAPFMYADSSP